MNLSGLKIHGVASQMVVAATTMWLVAGKAVHIAALMLLLP
jgi:hypothetical protein